MEPRKHLHDGARLIRETFALKAKTQNKSGRFSPGLVVYFAEKLILFAKKRRQKADA